LQGLICTSDEILKKLKKTSSSTTLLVLNNEISQQNTNLDVSGPQIIPHNNSVKQYYPSNDNTPQKTELRNTDELMLRNVETSQEVNDIIEKIFKVEGNFIKQGYISQMMSLLLRKAMVLLKYVEAELESKENGTTVPPDPQRDEINENQSPPVTPRDLRDVKEETSSMTRETKKKIRNDLGLREDSCFNLLLGIAEKLKPGIYYTVVGNQAWIEEKLIELFERF